jgi:hypothetical protein
MRNASLVDFRAVLRRHAELFRALPEWGLRVLVPRHLTKSAAHFEAAALRGCRFRCGSMTLMGLHGFPAAADGR